MKKIIYLLAAFAFNALSAQVGLNTTTPNAALDVKGSDGVLVPRVTKAQRTAMTVGAAQNGMLVFVTDETLPSFWFYDHAETKWKTLASSNTNFKFNSATYWGTTGTASTSSTSNYVGTSDATDFVIKANNTEAIRMNGSNQNVTVNGQLKLANVTPATSTASPLGFTGANEIKTAGTATAAAFNYLKYNLTNVQNNTNADVDTGVPIANYTLSILDAYPTKAVYRDPGNNGYTVSDGYPAVSIKAVANTTTNTWHLVVGFAQSYYRVTATAADKDWVISTLVCSKAIAKTLPDQTYDVNAWSTSDGLAPQPMPPVN
jgi:hypothetical protein